MTLYEEIAWLRGELRHQKRQTEEARKIATVLALSDDEKAIQAARALVMSWHHKRPGPQRREHENLP